MKTSSKPTPRNNPTPHHSLAGPIILASGFLTGSPRGTWCGVGEARGWEDLAALFTSLYPHPWEGF